MIVSLGLNKIRSSKKIKKSRFVITNVSIKDISEIIREFEDFPYEGYMRKRSKHMPNDSYFYLERHLSVCMMRFSISVGPVTTQMTNTQNMNNSDMSMQNIPNLHVCSSDKRKSKRIIANACSLGKSKSKSVHISANTRKVKYLNNETKYEEPLVTDNSVINGPIYFKLFKCGKKNIEKY